MFPHPIHQPLPWRGGGGGGPLDNPNLINAYDPSVLSSVTTDPGGNPGVVDQDVIQLDDLKGSGTLTAAGVDVPSLRQGGGATSIQFVLNDFLSNAIATPCSTVIVAMQFLDTGTLNGPVMNNADEPGSTNIYGVLSRSGGSPTLWRAGATFVSNDGFNIYADGVEDRNIVFDTPTVVSIDASNAVETPILSEGLSLGKNVAAPNHWMEGDIYYALFFDAVLSDEDRQFYEALAATKLPTPSVAKAPGDIGDPILSIPDMSTIGATTLDVLVDSTGRSLREYAWIAVSAVNLPEDMNMQVFRDGVGTPDAGTNYRLSTNTNSITSGSSSATSFQLVDHKFDTGGCWFQMGGFGLAMTTEGIGGWREADVGFNGFYLDTRQQHAISEILEGVRLIFNVNPTGGSLYIWGRLKGRL